MVRLKVFTCCSFMFLAFAGTTQNANAQNSIVPIIQASNSSRVAPAPRLPVAVGQNYTNGSCAADGGPTGSYFGKSAGGGFISRVRERLPEIDINMGRSCGCEGECGCEKRRYRSFFIGGNELDDFVNSTNSAEGTYRSGFTLGTARGQYVNEKTRMEIESTWRNNSGEQWGAVGVGGTEYNGHFNNFSSMLNLVREFGRSDRFDIYLGAGLGVSRQKGEMLVDTDQLNVRAWAFAYQGFVGVNFLKRERVDAYLEYRYFSNANTNMKLNGVIFDTLHYETSSLSLGLRFKR